MNGMSKCVVVILLMAGIVGLVRADEISDLRQQMEQQYNEMMKLQNRLIALEQTQKEQNAIVQRLDADGDNGFTIPERLSWIENIRFYGDFRYRYEWRDRDWKSDDKSDRHRIRARVGIKYKINEEMLFDFRLATAEFFENDDGASLGGDYVSGNKSLGDYWASKNAWIDRAYLSWTPNWAEGVTILFGKTYNPFYLAGKSDLIWDHDLNPEGIGVQYAKALNEKDNLFINTFAGYVQENGSNSDKRMLGIQGGLAHSFDDSSRLTGGISYFDYSSVKNESAIVDDAFMGNTSYDAGGGDLRYQYDYNLMEAFGDYAMKLGELPVTVYGDYVVNTASGVDEDTGWLLGTTINKAKDPGTWQFTYNYRDLEADAVFGAFTDSDFADGGTNSKGHKFNFKYALAKNATAGITYFNCEKGSQSPDDGYQRIQADLSVKF